MRVLYGVVGEGMGHAIRSRVVLEHLVQRHDVRIVASGRAHDYLARNFGNVHRIWGLEIAYQDNAVRNWRTVTHNVKGALSGIPQNVRAYFQLAAQFEPDVVVSDFETFSYLFGRNHRIPVISVDNIQVVNRCQHDSVLLAGQEADFELARAVVKAKLPGCFHYLVTSFFFPPVRKERTTLVHSILRPEILSARPSSGEHLLVYQTSTSNPALPAALKSAGIPCRVYGLRRVSEDEADGSLLYRPFNEARFVEDLCGARAVVTGGGFTLLSEAVYLGKPVYCVPVGGQFEQVLNALYLERLGYGVYAPTLTASTLAAFLERIPDFSRSLATYRHDQNRGAFAALGEQMVLAAKQAFQRRVTAP
ncbi:MAG: MJ1255/VC2487 family glycosyltransferase [Myxococcaceae bacterium]